MNAIIRKLDDLGRIVLPENMRREHNWGKQDSVSIISALNGILLTKHTPSCIFCGNAENLKYHEEKAICESCVRAIK